jgi:phage major head subunit gpT-like protein
MPALTPTFLMDLESRMSVISENEYARLNSNLWWQTITKLKSSTNRRELVSWLLSTAMIRDQGEDGGNISIEDLVAKYTEYTHRFAGGGLELRRSQLEDTDGNGMDLAAEWSSQIGAYMSYWPQKQVTHLLKNGHTAALYTGYDEVAYFAANHKVNPYKTSAGIYQNIFTGAASGSYPGACPIDDAVDLDDALVNLGKIFAYIASIKMPNGEDPRFLRPKTILVPPRMFPRAVQLTSAKFLAQVAGSGAGSGDVEAVIKALGFATPTMADELGGFESDTTFFIGCEQITSSQLGGVIYSQREPFSIAYYGQQTDAELARMNRLQWLCNGRNVVAPGHPFLLFKCKGS